MVSDNAWSRTCVCGFDFPPRRLTGWRKKERGSRNKAAGRDDDLYSAAIDFIRENKDGPFHVNVWGHATHFSVNTPAGLVAQFKDVTVHREDFSATMQHKFAECIQSLR